MNDNDIISSAKNSIRKSILASICGKADEQEPSLIEVLQRSSEYIDSIYRYICIEKKYLSELSELEITALQSIHNELQTIFPNLKLNLGNIDATEEQLQIKKLRDAIPPLNLSHLIKALPDSNECLAIFPYLLTAYYFNFCKKYWNSNENCYTRTVVTDVILINRENRSDNFYRDVDSYTKFFSLEDQIEKVLHAKPRKGTREEIYFGSIENYKKYLETPHINNHKKVQITPKQNSKLFQAFIYSIFTLACINSEGISEHVDYRESYLLFNQHTYAFYSIFLVDPKFDEEMTEKSLQNRISDGNCPITYFTLLDTFENVDIREMFENELRSYISDSFSEKLGIDFSGYTENAAYDTQEWYKNIAIQTSAQLHPRVYKNSSSLSYSDCFWFE